MKFKLSPFVTRSNAQRALVEAYQNNSITVAYGSAGTGKTYVCARLAAQSYQESDITKIVLVRPNVATGPSLGAFPGEVEDKLASWVAPIVGHLEGHMGKGVVKGAIKAGVIQLQPMETIRGCSFENSVILVDEAQNLSWEELKAVSTRAGDNSKLVLLGDPTQSDIRQQPNPLQRFVRLCKTHRVPIGMVEFTSDDIVRSDMTRRLVKAFEQDSKYGNRTPASK